MRLALATLISLATLPAAAAGPTVVTQMVDFYEVETRVAGDGAALVIVDDEVPEPLFISSSRGRLIVWWRARHGCEHLLVPRGRIEDKRTLVLSVETVAGQLPCKDAATIMETRVAQPPSGVWQLRADASGKGFAPLFFAVPSVPRPADFDSVQRRVPEMDALRRIGERVAWTYHEQIQSRPAIAAYRWLLSLDELHWRATLYHTRVFANIAVTRSKGAAVASMISMMDGLVSLRRELASDGVVAERDAKQREMDALLAWLEPTLRFFARRWHANTLTRFRAARETYEAYLTLFGDSDNAPRVRYFYAALLLEQGDAGKAAPQMALAAAGLKDAGQKKMAAACAVALAMETVDEELITPCRKLRPELPPLDLLPDIDDEHFARPIRDQEHR